MTNGATERMPPQVRAVWTAGQVAESLGVSPVTLRSWDTRYGIGPTTHSPGSHRRYSDQDVERLRAMCTLIEAGTPTREAAELASGEYRFRPRAESSCAQLAEELKSAAEALRFVEVAELPEHCLSQHGLSLAWREVFVPVLRKLGRRWARYGDCIEAESALSDAIEAALQRRIRRHPVAGETTGRAPLLLSCCPGERHVLAMKALRLALHERGVAAVLLGTGVPAETTLAAIEKLGAPVTVLWSLTGSSADPALARKVARGPGTACLAGPGWSAALRRRYLHTNDLDDAADVLSGIVAEQRV